LGGFDIFFFEELWKTLKYFLYAGYIERWVC